VGWGGAAGGWRRGWAGGGGRATGVVVRWGAVWLVLVGGCLRGWAGMWWKGASSSASRATVTPSWVTVGEPNFLSSATFRPLGPSVVFTALAMMSMPFLSFLRASSVKASCFAIRPSLIRRRDRGRLSHSG